HLPVLRAPCAEGDPARRSCHPHRGRRHQRPGEPAHGLLHLQRRQGRPLARGLLTMAPSRPSAEAQVAFLQNVQRVLAEGSFTATYKFALLLALADLAVERGDDSDAPLTLSTRDIAGAMIRLYWRQATPYPGSDDSVLRQNT